MRAVSRPEGAGDLPDDDFNFLARPRTLSRKKIFPSPQFSHLLVRSICKGYPSAMPRGKGVCHLRMWVRKLTAIVALFTLLLPGVSALADSLSASTLPACCNTSYCPLHHYDANSLQRDRKNCDSTGSPDRKDCSMRACDAVSKPIVGSALFILVTPMAFRGPSPTEVDFSFAFLAVPSVTSFPLTPPPRTFLS